MYRNLIIKRIKEFEGYVKDNSAGRESYLNFLREQKSLPKIKLYSNCESLEIFLAQLDAEELLIVYESVLSDYYR